MGGVKFRLAGACIAVAAITAEAQAGASSSGLQVAQTTEEFIEALRPEAPPPEFRTRGLQVIGPDAPEAEPEAEQVAPSIDMRIHFALNSADLTPSAVETLHNLGRALSSDTLSGYRFRIAGHTDASGSAEYNMNLSYARANAVRAFLMDNYGIDGAQLEHVGLGETRLFDPTQPASGLNRRVEITNLGR
jgi:outer membrane protein OmpA-like peptidoglycan-associated protein